MFYFSSVLLYVALRNVKLKDLMTDILKTGKERTLL